MKKIIIFSIFLIFPFVCFAQNGSYPENEIDNEEYNVYSALLNLLNNSLYVSQLPVVVNLTKSPVDINEGKDESNLKFYNEFGVNMDMIEELQNLNKKLYKLGNKFTIKEGVYLISPEEFNKFIKDRNGWDEFHRRFPTEGSIKHETIIELSRVVFNNDKTLAFFCYESHYETGLRVDDRMILKKEKKGNVEKWSIKAWDSRIR